VSIAGIAFYFYSSKQNSSTVQYQKYQTIVDSLEILDFKIRDEHNAHLITLHKDNANFLRAKSNSLRKSIQNIPVAAVSSSAQPPAQSTDIWIKNLKNAIYITCGILFLVICGLFFLIKRRKKSSSSSSKVSKQTNPKPKPKAHKTNTDDLFKKLEQLKNPQGIARPSGKKEKSTILSPNTLKKDAFLDALDRVEIPSNPPHVDQLDIPGENRTTPKVEERPVYPSTLSRLESEEDGKSDIIKLARRGFTGSEIARRLRVSQDQVEFVIRMHRERS
jgi:hypothetical protein